MEFLSSNLIGRDGKDLKGPIDPGSAQEKGNGETHTLGWKGRLGKKEKNDMGPMREPGAG